MALTFKIYLIVKYWNIVVSISDKPIIYQNKRGIPVLKSLKYWHNPTTSNVVIVKGITISFTYKRQRLETNGWAISMTIARLYLITQARNP